MDDEEDYTEPDDTETESWSDDQDIVEEPDVAEAPDTAEAPDVAEQPDEEEIPAGARPTGYSTTGDDGYVTDPELLKQLGAPTQQADSGYVTDPELLKQLGTPTQQADSEYVTDPELLKQLGTPPADDWSVAEGAGVLARSAGQAAVRGVGSAIESTSLLPEIKQEAYDQLKPEQLGAAAAPQTPPDQAAFDYGAAKGPYGREIRAREARQAAARESIAQDRAVPIEQRPGYQTGKDVQQWAEKNIPVTPQERATYPITEKTGSVIGGAVAPLAAAAVGTLVGQPVLGLTAASTIMAAQSAGDEFDRARDTLNQRIAEAKRTGDTDLADKLSRNVDVEAARAAGLSAVVNGTMGALPIGMVLAPVRTMAPGLVGRAWAIADHAWKSGVTFAGVTEAQHYIGEQLAKAYDPKAEYEFDYKRVVASLIGGAAMGAGQAAIQRRPAETASESRPGMPDTGGVAKEATPPPATEQPTSSTRYSKETPAAEPGSGVNVLKPGEADPTVAHGLRAGTEEAPAARPPTAEQPTNRWTQALNEEFPEAPPGTATESVVPPARLEPPAGRTEPAPEARTSTPEIDAAVARATAPEAPATPAAEPAAPAVQPVRAKNIGNQLKERVAAERAAQAAPGAPLDRPTANRVLNQPRELRNEAAKRGMTPEALELQARQTVGNLKPLIIDRRTTPELQSTREPPGAGPKARAADAADDLTIPDFLRREAQPIRRQDVVRGHSGRPIETRRLPIGTEGRILEKGAERATRQVVTPEKFKALASEQRGAPEQAMLRVQRAMGGGVLNPLVEHAGDLVHRMTTLAPYRNSGFGDVKPKVERLIRLLEHPYGFTKEMGENIRSNAEHNGVDPRKLSADIDKALKTFGDEHAKLPSYNAAHELAKRINVAIGNKDWKTAITGLKEMQKHLVDAKTWDKFAFEGLREPPRSRYMEAAERKGPLERLARDERGGVRMPRLSLPPGKLKDTVKASIDKLFDVGREIQMKVAPMAAGSQRGMATAKDFANRLRRNSYEWSRVDDGIIKDFTPERRKAMWDAVDAESVAQQTGTTIKDGLASLKPEEQAAIKYLQARSQAAWKEAHELGMVQGEGLPSYTPRMLINVAEGGGFGSRLPERTGGNLRTTTPQMKHRAHLTAEETEAAAKAKFGEGAEIVRDIRSLPLATAKLENAIAGRRIIDKIRSIGKATGQDMVAEGAKPAEGNWFTVDHPAFNSWRPKLVRDANGEAIIEGNKLKVATDKDGNTIYEKSPIYVNGEFEGPLRAVLTDKSGMLYSGAMALKGKTMSLIMNSPLIHNAVEWGRALPAMPGKVATFKIYFEGNRAKKDTAVMREAVDNGLVPIGKRFFNQDISSLMEQPNLTPGRSWTAQVLGFVPGLFNKNAGTAVKRGIDKAGDFWHNTMLWDRVGDLQMGLYTNLRENLINKGVDRQSASRVAAHLANRYAGALPQEAMSNNARKFANMLMFSRSFTLGNLGAMKDMLNGLPRDVRAQISRDVGSLDPKAEKYIKSLAQRKAIAIIGLDIGLMYIGNSLLQSGVNVLRGDKTLDEEMRGYVDRLSSRLQKLKEKPSDLLSPLAIGGAVVGGVAGGPAGAVIGGVAGAGIAQLRHISATSENEPGRQNRVMVGRTKDGTAIYMRNPAGKIGEEFEGWLTEPIDLAKRKEGTIARPLWEIMANDKGFGRKVYDPNAHAPEEQVHNIARIMEHIAKAQVPEGQIRAASDLATGQGDPKLNALQTFGPVAGVTFSRGAPGGPAQGELYRAREEHQFKLNEALPEIRRMIQRDEIDKAVEKMNELGVPPGLQKFYIRTTLNPETRLTPRALKDFQRYGTPEQVERFNRALERQQQ